MVCCTGYCAAEAQFDRKVAERDLRRYRRRGADATTRHMLAEVRRCPLEGRRLLDVGGGIGVISRELADTRLASATMVGASPAYLVLALVRAEHVCVSELLAAADGQEVSGVCSRARADGSGIGDFRAGPWDAT
jgi:2-polyprenyl-3-methyl-5-hydroxy-6-metoxy-1,4-benzoquinol methylase